MLLRTDIFNALASDLNLNGLDEFETNVLDVLTSIGGHGNLQVDLVDQITVTGDLAGNTLAKASGSVNADTPPFGVFLRSDAKIFPSGLDHTLSLSF